jgi:hypothetical protein
MIEDERPASREFFLVINYWCRQRKEEDDDHCCSYFEHCYARRVCCGTLPHTQQQQQQKAFAQFALQIQAFLISNSNARVLACTHALSALGHKRAKAMTTARQRP